MIRVCSPGRLLSLRGPGKLPALGRNPPLRHRNRDRSDVHHAAARLSHCRHGKRHGGGARRGVGAAGGLRVRAGRLLFTAPPQEIMAAASEKVIVIVAMIRATVQSPRFTRRANAALRAASSKSATPQAARMFPAAGDPSGLSGAGSIGK